MAAEFTVITRQEMIDYLSPLGYEEVELPRTNEMVMQKTLAEKRLTWKVVVRIYTSIVGNECREVGGDAIRVVPMLILHPKRAQRWNLHIEYPLGRNRRVHRVVNWRKNIADRIGIAEQARVKISPAGFPMVVKKGRGRTGKPFWASLGYPEEKFTLPYREVA